MVSSWKSIAPTIRFEKSREKNQKERVEVDKKLRYLKSENFAFQAYAETATRKIFNFFISRI